MGGSGFGIWPGASARFALRTRRASCELLASAARAGSGWMLARGFLGCRYGGCCGVGYGAEPWLRAGVGLARGWLSLQRFGRCFVRGWVGCCAGAGYGASLGVGVCDLGLVVRCWHVGMCGVGLCVFSWLVWCFAVC